MKHIVIAITLCFMALTFWLTVTYHFLTEKHDYVIVTREKSAIFFCKKCLDIKTFAVAPTPTPKVLEPVK